MPLGRLTKPQVEKGQEVLQKIEAAISAGRSKEIEPLSSAFFSLIPTDFGAGVGCPFFFFFSFFRSFHCFPVPLLPRRFSAAVDTVLFRSV